MKLKLNKYLFSILITILILPFIVNAESCNLNISLTSININTITGNVEELTKASVENKKLI